MLYIKNKKKNNQKVLLLVEPGGIGDYVLLRPYLKFIRISEKYKDYKILFLARNSFYDFVMANDSEIFDGIFPYNPEEFDKNKDYKKYLINRLNTMNIDTIINLRAITIDNLPDYSARRQLIKRTKAKYKIADVLKLRDNPKHENKLKIYTDIIYSDIELIFEGERRRRFFEKLLDLNIPEQDTKITTYTDLIDNQSIILSLMSSSEFRSLPNEKCIQLLNLLLEKTDYKLVLTGTLAQYSTYQKIIQKTNNRNRIINIAGKTNITTLTEMLKKCAFCIGIDSGTVHIANSIGCKTICLSNGIYYKRFHPYPNNTTITYIYPQWFKIAVKNGKLDLVNGYGGGDLPWGYGDIDVDEIISAVGNLGEKLCIS